MCEGRSHSYSIIDLQKGTKNSRLLKRIRKFIKNRNHGRKAFKKRFSQQETPENGTAQWGRKRLTGIAFKIDLQKRKNVVSCQNSQEVLRI